MLNESLQSINYIGSSTPVSPTFFQIKTAQGNPFRASHIWLSNDSAVVFAFSLTGSSSLTTLSSGSPFILTTGLQLNLQGFQSGCESVALFSTSSSTAGLALRLGAWG